VSDDRDICERLEDPRYDGGLFLRMNAADEIRRLRKALTEIALLTNWPKNKTDHRLPVVRHANEIASAVIAEQGQTNA
jgi:hypothetical protein